MQLDLTNASSMLSIERTRELLADLNLPDDQLEDVRVVCEMFCEVAYDAWRAEQQTNEKQRATEGSA